MTIKEQLKLAALMLVWYLAIAGLVQAGKIARAALGEGEEK